MSINEILLEEIKDCLPKYNCYHWELEHFLVNSLHSQKRRKEAINIIENIMIVHGKKALHKHVVELARIESGIQELEPWVRDHVVHAVLCFLLGIYINEKYLNPIYGVCVDEFQWKLAGLFHDIGYPVQVAKDILKPFTGKVEEIKDSLGIQAPGLQFNIVPIGLEELFNNKNSLSLIQHRLNQWGLNIDAQHEYHSRIKQGEVCHGIISALVLLKVLDYMYQKYNPLREYKTIYAPNSNIDWNQRYFDEDVISACAAIFIHNLKETAFEEAKINPKKAPVAFLLKISDCLQEWERPKKDMPNGLPADLFNITIKNGTLILSTQIREEDKEKIRQELKGYLDVTDVQIN